jgi:hypothetical protein
MSLLSISAGIRIRDDIVTERKKTKEKTKDRPSLYVLTLKCICTRARGKMYKE